ncbi:MAG: hypothetical protein AAF456_23155, partial [Planctomycetota bacterium]
AVAFLATLLSAAPSIGFIWTSDYRAPSAEKDAQSISGESENDEEIRQLIEQLGSDEYQMRTMAFNRLVDIGTPTVPFLEEARLSGDSEIRLNAARILSLIEQKAFEQRMDNFLAGKLDGDTETLEGWPEFASIAGDGGSSRELFARIYEQYWPMFANIEDGVWHSDPDLQTRETELFISAGSSSIRLLYASIAGAFLLSIEAEPGNGRDEPQILENLRRNRAISLLTRMSDNKLKTYISTGGYRSEFDAIAGTWIRSLEINDSTIASKIVDTAIATCPAGISGQLGEIATSREFSIHVRCNALRAIALTGGAEDIVLISPLIHNNEMVGAFSRLPGGVESRQSVVVIDGVVEVVSNDESEKDDSVEVRLGDVALLTAVLLSDNEPEDYGFQLSPDEDQREGGFILRNAGFASEDLRETARREWLRNRE